MAFSANLWPRLAVSFVLFAWKHFSSTYLDFFSVLHFFLFSFFSYRMEIWRWYCFHWYSFNCSAFFGIYQKQILIFIKYFSLFVSHWMFGAFSKCHFSNRFPIVNRAFIVCNSISLWNVVVNLLVLFCALQFGIFAFFVRLWLIFFLLFFRFLFKLENLIFNHAYELFLCYICVTQPFIVLAFVFHSHDSYAVIVSNTSRSAISYISSALFLFCV